MMTQKQMQEIADRIADEWEVSRFPVKINWRLKTSRGNAHYGFSLGTMQRIVKNITLTPHFMSEEDQRDTLLHEIAHAIAWSKYAARGHGATWRSICLRIGGNGRATYTGTPPRVAANAITGTPIELPDFLK